MYNFECSLAEGIPIKLRKVGDLNMTLDLDEDDSMKIVNLAGLFEDPKGGVVNYTLGTGSDYKAIDGLVLVWNEPTSQFIMTSVIDNEIKISDLTESYNATTGALVVSGGVQICVALHQVSGESARPRSRGVRRLLGEG